MSRLRIHTLTISLDGYGAGPRQDLGNPFGVGGLALHEWIDLPALGYESTEHVPSAGATHIVVTRRG